MKFLSCASLLFAAAFGKSTETITGYIYADNYFEFYFNGELVAVDSIDFIPHNAEAISFEAPKEGLRSFAILAKDFSDDLTSLEYNNNCIGDGGLRVMFDDGTVSNGEWKCYTFYYGPIDGGDCFGDCYGDTCSADPRRFIAPQCKFGQLGTTGEDCRGEYYEYDVDWFKSDFDDSTWEYATEFTDDVVGWGVTPSADDVASGVIDPQSLDWSQFGDSTFIWRPSLDFDNRILCRYSYYPDSSDSSDSSDN